MAQPYENISSTSIVSEYSLFNGPSDTGCRSTLRNIDSYTNCCLKWMENIVGASVSSSRRPFGPEEEEEEGEEEEEKEEGEEEEKEDGEQEQEVEQAKERENELAALGLTMVCLNTVILVTQMPYFLKFRAAACTSSPYRNIRMDAYSLQCIFDQSLIAMDQLQQMYDTCFLQYAGDNDEQSFALRVNDARSNAINLLEIARKHGQRMRVECYGAIISKAKTVGNRSEK